MLRRHDEKVKEEERKSKPDQKRCARATKQKKAEMTKAFRQIEAKDKKRMYVNEEEKDGGIQNSDIPSTPSTPQNTLKRPSNAVKQLAKLRRCVPASSSTAVQVINRNAA